MKRNGTTASYTLGDRPLIRLSRRRTRVSTMPYKRVKLYIAAQDISDAPQWATDLAARRWSLSNQEKADCTRRLQTEHQWTMVKVAKLFGVTPSAVARWLRASTEEGRTLQREAGSARREQDPYREGRYKREWREQAHHGSKGVRAAMWREQDGLCYLCKNPLGPGLMAVIEHDHRCCPPGKSCGDCRRGLACNRCNNIIAFAHDDPELLERIAANLRPAVERVTALLAQDGA